MEQWQLDTMAEAIKETGAKIAQVQMARGNFTGALDTILKSGLDAANVRHQKSSINASLKDKVKE